MGLGGHCTYICFWHVDQAVFLLAFSYFFIIYTLFGVPFVGRESNSTKLKIKT